MRPLIIFGGAFFTGAVLGTVGIALAGNVTLSLSETRHTGVGSYVNPAKIKSSALPATPQTYAASAALLKPFVAGVFRKDLKDWPGEILETVDNWRYRGGSPIVGGHRADYLSANDLALFKTAYDRRAQQIVKVSFSCAAGTLEKITGADTNDLSLHYLDVLYQLLYVSEALKHLRIDGKVVDALEAKFLNNILQYAGSDAAFFWPKDPSVAHVYSPFPFFDRLNLALARLFIDGQISKVIIINYDTGCGFLQEWSVVAKVVSIPDGAKVYLISRYWYEVCKARGDDPLDRKICPGWFNATIPSKVLLIGGYVYQAEWPDGTLTSGSFEVPAANWEKVDMRVTTIKVTE